MGRILIIIVTFLTAAACQTGTGKDDKTIIGEPIQYKETEQIDNPKFNAYLFIPDFTGVKRKSRTSHTVIVENYIAEYNIRVEDLCVWDSNSNAIAGVTGSLETCQDHLEQSFALGNE